MKVWGEQYIEELIPECYSLSCEGVGRAIGTGIGAASYCVISDGVGKAIYRGTDTECDFVGSEGVGRAKERGTDTECYCLL